MGNRCVITAALLVAGTVGGAVLAQVEQEGGKRTLREARPPAIPFTDKEGRPLVQKPDKRSWGPEQATGAPDTQDAGDISTAWASKTQDGQDEWLQLDYARPVRPVAIHIHETYNPGAVYRVTAVTSGGREVTLWEGVDPTSPAQAKGVSVLRLRTNLSVKRIRVYLDSVNTQGWNEIDAVGMEDGTGRVHWATRAEASSTYADAWPAPGNNFVVDDALVEPFRNPPGGQPLIFRPDDANARRIRALEAENAALRAELEALKRQLRERR